MGAFTSTTHFSCLRVALALGCAISSSWYSVLADRIGKGTPGLILAAYSLPITATCFISQLILTRSLSVHMALEGWLSH